MSKTRYKLIIKAISWLTSWGMQEYADAVNSLLIDYELLKIEAEDKREE